MCGRVIWDANRFVGARKRLLSVLVLNGLEYRSMCGVVLALRVHSPAVFLVLHLRPFPSKGH